VKAESGLDGFKVAALDGEPGGGPTDKAGVMRGKERCVSDALIVSSRYLNARRTNAGATGQEHDHCDAATQGKAEHQQE